MPTIAGEMSSTISEILEASSLLNADELLELDELLLDSEDVLLAVTDCVCCWLDDCFEVS